MCALTAPTAPPHPPPLQTTAEVQIEVIDDDVEEEDEQFFVRLFDPMGGALLGSVSRTTVTIINDDLPGTFVFAEEEIDAVSNKGQVTVRAPCWTKVPML